ncbi:putative UPF0481 protein At3g02645 [Pistacia vera]|uniref:putative UPF0481 protein At3g02645 n=1 Tax=Pistacia vera TaxID=55513 RepID=UPI001263CC31|nr:putative UPF0481 protein At3g02645 [Pistacia vera]
MKSTDQAKKLEISGFFKLVYRAKKLVKLEDLVKELRIDIDKNLEPELDARRCCIYRVPKYLRSVNEEAYTPQLISIGPLHHGKEELANMEKIKRQYVKSFVEQITIENRDKILNFIKDNEKNIRNCYAETSELGSIEYIMMILYDAIFIIELLLRDQLGFDVSDLLLSTASAKASLCLDFQLLENQLPYFILEKICELADLAGLNMPTFMELSRFFFGCFDGLELSTLTPQVVVKHLTDWRRITILEHYQRSEQRNQWIDDLPCAVKLHESGVKFKCFEGEHSLIDIRLEKRKQQIQCFEVLEMQIPHLKIFDSTESLLRNVMALEQCHYPWNTHVCNYVRLMNYLIDTEKDVDLLVGEGIISNHDMGDNASIANMFNKLSLFISFSKSSYYDNCEKLKGHSPFISSVSCSIELSDSKASETLDKEKLNPVILSEVWFKLEADFVTEAKARATFEEFASITQKGNLNILIKKMKAC